MNHKLADKNSGSDPEDIQLVTSAATAGLRMEQGHVGLYWNNG